MSPSVSSDASDRRRPGGAKRCSCARSRLPWPVPRQGRARRRRPRRPRPRERATGALEEVIPRACRGWGRRRSCPGIILLGRCAGRSWAKPLLPVAQRQLPGPSPSSAERVVHTIPQTALNMAATQDHHWSVHLAGGVGPWGGPSSPPSPPSPPSPLIRTAPSTSAAIRAPVTAAVANGTHAFQLPEDPTAVNAAPSPAPISAASAASDSPWFEV